MPVRRVSQNLEARREAIARRLKEVRRRHHWTQDMVADVLGCSRNRYNRVEQGKAELTASEAWLFADTFQIPISEMFSLEADTDRKPVFRPWFLTESRPKS